MTYRIEGLDAAPYRLLFGLSDEALKERGAVRMKVTGKPGFPCRVTLDDANEGETVLLVNHVSHDVPNPYRASHAIFVTEGADEPARFEDQVPPALDRRILSLRAFDEQGLMVDAALAEPGEADSAIRTLFDRPDVASIHAHNAIRGCFAAKIERS
jgi:hypothetical protein